MRRAQRLIAAAVLVALTGALGGCSGGFGNWDPSDLLDFLDTKPLDALDPAERRLLALCLSFAHVALAVELQGPDEARHAEMRAYMRITRSPADSLA